MFGLPDSDIDMIKEELKKFSEIKRAIIFGSRAIGNYKKGSDIDIVIKGEKVTTKTISDINYLLNEVSLLPYFFDILHYEDIKNENLREHIDSKGIEFYRKENS